MAASICGSTVAVVSTATFTGTRVPSQQRLRVADSPLMSPKSNVNVSTGSERATGLAVTRRTSFFWSYVYAPHCFEAFWRMTVHSSGPGIVKSS